MAPWPAEFPPPTTSTRRPRERRRFRGRGAVIHARARVLRHAGRGMLAIEHAGRGQHGSRHDFAAIAERETLVSRIDRDSGHFERREKLRAEPLRLRQGAARQLAAADAGRKSEIVLDPGAGARLSARRVPVEQQCPQPFRCAVHRRRKAGRTGADDHEVVHIEGGRERSAEALGHLRRLRVAQHGVRLRRTAPEARPRPLRPHPAARARPGPARRRASDTE